MQPDSVLDRFNSREIEARVPLGEQLVVRFESIDLFDGKRTIRCKLPNEKLTEHSTD